jgi:hypothetical protein
MSLPLSEQKFMAFEGLHTWAKAVVMQADRLTASRDSMITRMQDFTAARIAQRARAGDNPIRDLIHTFHVERLFFCIAAAKFFEYRKWVVELKLLDPGIFAELDNFEADAKAMRDLNEHAREYFAGPGLRRKDWDTNLEQFNADPTGTNGALIGGRLDWVKLAEAMAKLIPSIPNMLPGIYEGMARDRSPALMPPRL